MAFSMKASSYGGTQPARFIIAPKTVGYSGGVGDDDYGWAVDGQHALRSLGRWEGVGWGGGTRYLVIDVGNPISVVINDG